MKTKDSGKKHPSRNSNDSEEVRNQGRVTIRSRVLLADNNADMREYVSRLLKGRYDVTAVADGQAALEAVHDNPPDLILTDIMMPRLDGFGLLRALRDDPATKTIPIILLSARAGEESRVEGMEHGADDYLIKPFSAPELLARVDMHVRMARMRQEVEVTLRNSEARFRNLADTAPAILWVTEPDGSCSFISRGWYEFTGQTEQEGLGRNGFGWLDAVHPDDREQAGRIFLEANTARCPFSLEYRLRRHDSEYRWAVDAGRPRFGLNQEFLGYIGSVLDITERVRQEEALRNSQLQLHNILQTMTDGFQLIDRDWRFTDMNGAARRMMREQGSDPDALIGRQVFDDAFPETKNTLLHHQLQCVMNERVPVEFDYLYEPWQRWCHIRAYPVPDTGIGVFFQDITERKQADEALRASEQETKRARDYAEATLRTSPVPLLVLENDFRVNTANEAFYDTFQVNPAATRGRLVYELGNGQWNIPKLRELLESILPKHTVFKEFEVTHDFESIGRRTMLLNARRMENEPDVPDRIVLVIEDITERKAIQERLRLFTKELEAQVEDRTRDLVQSQDRLRAMATELNLAEQRERKRLATELHDHLQQSLVLGRLILAQGKQTGVILPAGLGVMNKMDDIFSEALTYTRTLVADLSPPVLRDHGLPAGLKWLGGYMKKHELTVAVTVPETDDLTLPEDQAVLLFQSVRELLINSSKHAGTKHADVRLQRHDEYLRIEVSDQGTGFDPAKIAATGTSSGGLSSKFGLFSIQERMRALGGSFSIQSAHGEGTTATLTLPLQRGAEHNVLSAESSGTANKIRSTHSALKKNAPIRVLLVDDHPMMRQGLRSIVTAYDHLEVVGEAGDGAEAVELAQRLEPDVVVMDINMPKMDGIAATRQIKANQPTTVVIGLSVNQSDDTQQKMKAAGASTYLTKESAVDALCQAIEQAMSYK